MSKSMVLPFFSCALAAAIAVALPASALAAPVTLTVLTHSSFDIAKGLVAEFEQKNNAKVQFIKGGDAGAMLSKLILAKQNPQQTPLADLVYGIDNTLSARALRADLLEVYKSPAIANIALRYWLDPLWRLTPVNYGYVALNIDRAWFQTHQLALPKSLNDLTKPAYKGLLVLEHPATSSPGQAFLLATVKTFGETGYQKFWQALKTNDVAITNGWEAAYYTEFSKNGGSRPIVLSYASSPAAEVFYSEQPLTASPTANLLLPGSVFLQVEGVGVIKGSKQRDLARKFIDFMLSPAVQEDIPNKMWVYPVNRLAKLPAVFAFASIPGPQALATPSASSIASKAASYLEAWQAIMTR
jgi:thiamine transport system substrate-binding protein